MEILITIGIIIVILLFFTPIGVLISNAPERRKRDREHLYGHTSSFCSLKGCPFYEDGMSHGNCTYIKPECFYDKKDSSK